MLPPNAEPHDYSLTDMTRAVARFNDSGNNLAYYPDTPFQILYVNRPNHTGSFTVKPGTTFYVPVVNVNDSPPVLGVFPKTPAQARGYLTDPAELGGHDFKIVVDGVTTVLSTSYLGGPVTKSLPNGGQHTITLGAFLRPLTPGTHKVTISGTLDGTLIGGSFSFTDTYTVTVNNRT